MSIYTYLHIYIHTMYIYIYIYINIYIYIYILSQTEFLSKDADPFLKMFFLQVFFSHFYYRK